MSFKLSRDRQRLIGRTIIDEDDFFPIPGLCNRGAKRFSNPLL
jgi:hypothetical protein